MRKLLLTLPAFLFYGCAYSQTLYFPAGEHSDSAALIKSMPALAKKVIAAYKNPDSQAYFDNLFRFQILAQEYQQSVSSLDSLIRIFGGDKNDKEKATGIQFRAYALTMMKQPSPQSFNEEFQKVLAQLYTALPEKATATASYYFETKINPIRLQLAGLLESHAGKDSI